MADNVLQIPLAAEVSVQISEDGNIALINGKMHATDSYAKLSKAIMLELGFKPPKRKPRKKTEEVAPVDPASDDPTPGDDLDLD